MRSGLLGIVREVAAAFAAGLAAYLLVRAHDGREAGLAAGMLVGAGVVVAVETYGLIRYRHPRRRW